MTVLTRQDVTEDYLARCVADRAGLVGVSHGLRLPDTYANSYGTLLLDRPLFLTRGQADGLGRDLRALFDLLTDLPSRLFGNDLARYASALGLDPVLAEIMSRGARSTAFPYARADLYRDASGFRLLEFNIGSELGGIDSAQLNRAFLDEPAFASFAGAHRLGYTDTAEHLARILRAAATRVGATGRRPSMALVEARDALREHAHVFAAIREAMQAQGIDLALTEIQELRAADGKITLHGEPVDVILRYFAADELLGDDEALAVLDDILAADAADQTALVSHLQGALAASKGSLGLLHEDRARDTFSDRERELVDRLVPWTRVLGRDAWGEPRADTDELFSRCRREQSDLIIKPGNGRGGSGAVLGRDVTPEAWSAALQDGVRSDHVVQRIVLPVTEQVLDPATGERQDWVANWGVFLTDQGFGGAFVRALRPEHGSVISYSNPQTRGTAVFTALDDPDPGALVDGAPVDGAPVESASVDGATAHDGGAR